MKFFYFLNNVDNGISRKARKLVKQYEEIIEKFGDKTLNIRNHNGTKVL